MQIKCIQQTLVYEDTDTGCSTNIAIQGVQQTSLYKDTDTGRSTNIGIHGYTVLNRVSNNYISLKHIFPMIYIMSGYVKKKFLPVAMFEKI